MTKKKEKSLEELQTEIEKSQKELQYLDHREKILRKKVIPQLTRSARTNRLCTRAGMLESFLGQPELLTNDQVMELLKVAFRQTEVKEALKKMIEDAEKEIT